MNPTVHDLVEQKRSELEAKLKESDQSKKDEKEIPLAARGGWFKELVWIKRLVHWEKKIQIVFKKRLFEEFLVISADK